MCTGRLYVDYVLKLHAQGVPHVVVINTDPYAYARAVCIYTDIFTSHFRRAFCKLIGTRFMPEKSFVAAGHVDGLQPSSNGQTERWKDLSMTRVMEGILRSMLRESQDDWDVSCTMQNPLSTNADHKITDLSRSCCLHHPHLLMTILPQSPAASCIKLSPTYAAPAFDQ